MRNPAGHFSRHRKPPNKTGSSPRRRRVVIGGLLLFLGFRSLFAQVGPAEIKNPQLKATEQAYLPQLLALNQTISGMKFPFKFSLNRYVGLDPKDQIGADMRGLEFVNFHEREILKFTGNYNAAFSAESLTPNQRAGRVLNEVILPLIRLLPDHFDDRATFDAFGFEIGYHVQRHSPSYEYEGKENLVVILGKSDALRYGALREDALRQEILNRSEIYLSGAPLGLALNTTTPFDIEALVQRPGAKSSPAAQNRASQKSAAQIESAPSPPKPEPQVSAQSAPIKTAEGVQPSAIRVGTADLDALQKKYQPELESLRQDGVAKYHFVEYAPVSFVAFRNQPALQATLRNPQTFDKDASSIYRRAARTFDLFLAPQLRGILEKVPESMDVSTVDFTVVLDLTSPSLPKSSEAIEFIIPLKLARQFVNADITNQDLINESVVLVNGVRISLNLAQVE